MANIAMRPVHIDDAARARAKEIKKYAVEHLESLTALRQRLISGLPLKDAENFTMQVPVGYNIAYTIEQRDIGWVQHISVFQSAPRMMPQPPAVARIITELFGIEAKKSSVAGIRGGVLAEAMSVDQQQLPNGCIAVDLLYPFTFPNA